MYSVIVFSAFVRDVIAQQLAPHQPLTVVDKTEPAALATKVANLLPNNQDTMADRLRRFLAARERARLRLAAIAGARPAHHHRKELLTVVDATAGVAYFFAR